MEWRSVTSRYHGSKISGSLQREGHLHWRKMEEQCFFLSAVKHGKVIHFKASVFPPYLQHHGLLRSRNFATMATWRNDLSSLLLESLCKSVFERLTSTGSLFAIILNYLDATKFVFLSVFTITEIILLHEKFLQSDWLRAVVFQLNLKYLHVKITNHLRVVV